MDLQEALLKRRSIRKYLDKSVSKELIDELLHAAMAAPTACNKMPWDFFVVSNKQLLLELNKATRFTNIKAPLAIIVCGNLTRALPLQLSSYWIQDCSAATENILLRATSLGLGSLWCGIHPQKKAEERVRQILNLSSKQIPLNIIYIGYAAEEKEARDKYNEKRVHFID